MRRSDEEFCLSFSLFEGTVTENVCYDMFDPGKEAEIEQTGPGKMMVALDDDAQTCAFLLCRSHWRYPGRGRS